MAVEYIDLIGAEHQIQDFFYNYIIQFYLDRVDHALTYKT